MTFTSNSGVHHWQVGPSRDGHAHSSYSGDLSSHSTPTSSYNYLSPNLLAALKNDNALQGAMPYLQPQSSGPTYMSHHLAASQLQSLRDLPDGQLHGHEFRPDAHLGYGHISAGAQSSQAFPSEDGYIGASSASVHEDGLSEDHSNDRRQSNKKTEMNRKAQQRYRCWRQALYLHWRPSWVWLMIIGAQATFLQISLSRPSSHALAHALSFPAVHVERSSSTRHDAWCWTGHTALM